VGWLDLVALRYAAMISGATELCVTLLDVLSGEEELKLATSYRTSEGETDRFIADGYALSGVTPVYETMAGFSQDITGVRTFDELPEAARAYLNRIEAFVGVRIGIVSVGPDREQTIIR
jgi:adenylosuccinate synthase